MTELSADERAGVRAFLQRCEVRMSTLHRVATALLSGAGLTVVLPIVARDSVSGVLRSIVEGDVTAVDVLLVIAVSVMLLLPCAALWLLIRDLTRFYFHANHFGAAGHETFSTRFTLTALRLPSDELGAEARAELDEVRDSPAIVRLLVPTNEGARRAIDRQLAVYGHPHGHDETDLARARHLFEFAASTSRPLLEEVAKLEHGMVRHTLRLQVVVLRYVKALLTLLITAVAVYAADAVVAKVAPGTGIDVSDSVTMAAIVLIWAPIVMVAVTSPIRWIEQLLRSDGATSTALTDDIELTFVERVSLRIAILAWVAAAAAMALAVHRGGVSGSGRWWVLALIVATAVLIAGGILSGRFGRVRSVA